jgi:Acetyl-CoA dehydrogenase C-terminal like
VNDAAALNEAWTDLLEVVARLRQEPADKALHNASAFLSAFGHVVVGWLWLDQALTAATALEAPDE